MASIFSGMLFLIMLTGWLSADKFGLWEVILTLIGVASYPAGFLGFWATRDIARGRILGRTVVVLNFAMSSAATVAYVLVALVAYPAFNSPVAPFLFALVLIPLAYWNQAANAIAAGHRPSAFGYSLLVSELGKLLVAYVALFVMRLDIYGVILAIMVSYLLQSLATSLLVRDTLREAISFDAGRTWAKNFWVPAIYSLSPMLITLDTVVAGALGSTDLVGHYQAAFQIGILVSYVSFLSYALYPLLLKGGSDEVPNATLDLVLLFGVPMATGVIFLSPRLLMVLNPVYVAAGADMSVSLGILGVAGLVVAVSGLIDSTLIGREKADLREDRGIASYMKSDFAFVSKVNIAGAAAYVGSVVAEVWAGVAMGVSVTLLVTVWASIQLLIMCTTLAVKVRRVRKVVRLQFPRELWYYLGSSLVMAAALFFLQSAFLLGGEDRLLYGIKTMAVVIAGAAVYFGFLSAINPRVRALGAALLRGGNADDIT